MSLLLLLNQNADTGYYDGGLDLYVAGHIAGNSGVSLYMYGYSSGDSSINLFTTSFDTSSGNLPLYASGTPNSGELSTTLYAAGHSPFSSGLDLYTSGTPNSGEAGISLYASGMTISYANITLSAEGFSTSSGTKTLYAFGAYPYSSEVELALPNVYDVNATGVALYTGGLLTKNSGLALSAVGSLVCSGYSHLYTVGYGSGTRSVNLFAKVREPLTYSQGLNLATQGFSYGTGVVYHEQTAGLNLYANSINGNAPTGTLNLSLLGQNYAALTGTMNLSIYGQFFEAANSVTLFTFNETVYNSVNLFIEGLAPDVDSVDSAVPGSGRLNLYIHRKTFSEMIPLFLRGPTDIESGVCDLYLFGAFPATGAINLVLYNAIGVFTSGIDCYSHGF